MSLRLLRVHFCLRFFIQRISQASLKPLDSWVENLLRESYTTRSAKFPFPVLSLLLCILKAVIRSTFGSTVLWQKREAHEESLLCVADNFIPCPFSFSVGFQAHVTPLRAATGRAAFYVLKLEHGSVQHVV